MCSDIVSRLPNEVSNYEPCYFLRGAGCDRGKEERETGERESGGMNKKTGKDKHRSEQVHITDAALQQLFVLLNPAA